MVLRRGKAGKRLFRSEEFETLGAIALVIIIVLLAYTASTYIVAEPKIAVIDIFGTIAEDGQVNDILEALDEAENRRDVKAVVLHINSPGGDAAKVEEVFFKVLEVQEEKPVVSSIDLLGASGGYYVAAGTNYIFAKPSSITGSIGVVTTLPQTAEEDPSILTSGPYKRANSKESIHRKSEQLLDAFLSVIITNRHLKIDPIELTSADIYGGVEAKEIGLVDELGGMNLAIQKAAELAGFRNYNTVKLLGNETIESVYSMSVSLEKEVDSNTGPLYSYIYLNLDETMEGENE